MQEILVTQANQLAIETEFVQRDRVLTGSSFVRGLVSGWQNNPQASLSGLSQAMGNAGTPITRQGLSERFNERASDFLRRLLGMSLAQVVDAMPVSDTLLSRFAGVELVDSSIITLPNELQNIWQGSGGFGKQARVSALKLNVCWDVGTGQLRTLDLSDGTHHDRHSEAHQHEMEAGTLRIADLGYFKVGDFAKMEAQGAYWLSRYKLKTLIYDEYEARVDLATWLPQQVGDTLDCKIYLSLSERLECRLVAERVPLAIVRQRHERIRETARQNQKQPSDLALAMAHWTLYVTNLPPDLLATQEIFVLGRYRWQIELLFKLWKQNLGVDKWTSANPHRILCEIYGKLIVAVVTHWQLLVACWHNPRRSFCQAMHTIRALAWQFANSIYRASLLRHAFDSLCLAVSKVTIGRSHADPRAWQLICEDMT